MRLPSRLLTGLGLCSAEDLLLLREAIAHEERARSLVPMHQPLTHITELFGERWLPQWHCEMEERLGHIGDGGKWLCDPYQLAEVPDCLVYSIGCADVYDFETALQKVAKNCEIYIFDHTMNRFGLRGHPNIHFFPIGLAQVTSLDGKKLADHFEWDRNRTEVLKTNDSATIENPPSMKIGQATLTDLVRLLGHSDRTIDVLKIDIEGFEYLTLTPLLSDDALFSELPPIRQVALEIHSAEHLYKHRKAKPLLTLEMLTDPVGQPHKLLQAFLSRGFMLFHREMNLLTPRTGECEEFSLINTLVPTARLERSAAHLTFANLLTLTLFWST